jgi:hypothetical protein
VVGALLVAASAGADELLLKDGGRLRGALLNRDRQGADDYEFRTLVGVRLVVGRERVHELKTETSAQLEYRQIAPLFADTVSAQWRLAEWCADRGLTSARKIHLRRVIELETDHLKARHALGYSRVDGRWITRDQFRDEEGLQFYRGRWLTKQEVTVLAEKDAANQRQKKWLRQLKQWRKDINNRKRFAIALRQFHRLQDPEAVPALMQLWLVESARPMKFIYLEALERIGSDDAIAGLIHISLRDPDTEVFHEAARKIVANQRGKTLDSFITALKSNHNGQINRAAVVLGQMEESSAIPALIDRLVSRHHFVFRQGSKDKITSTFSSSGIGSSGACGSIAGLPQPTCSGMSTGSKTIVLAQDVPNQDVLQALVNLTGQSYGFNRVAWRRWWDTQKSGQSISVRRGS